MSRHCPFSAAVTNSKLICATVTNRDTCIFRLPSSVIFLSFDHRVCFLMNILRRRSDLPFSRKSDRKKEKSVVSFMHEQPTQLDDIAIEQTIICRQLFAGHAVGSRPMKRKKNLLRMITCYLCLW